MIRRGEFDVIAQSLAPLSDTARGLGLTDDAALYAPAPGRTAVLSTDTLVAGVHFLPDDPPGDIARKALRVNLSDIAAMGAVPQGYLLNLALRETATDAWLDAFVAGLAADQAIYRITLFGGDTVRTPGPLTVSVTAIGEVRIGRALKRGNAQIGDGIYVTGTIGDAAAGLRLLTDPADVPNADALIARYRLPQPRVTVGPRLVGLATAAIDVSDGLVADLAHICETSAVAATVQAADVPLSRALRAAMAGDILSLPDALTGGDDYELLFCAPPTAHDALIALGAELDVPVTPIGEITSGHDVTVIDENGTPVVLPRAGHTHF
ncbi:MAG: thiamine-phosphate kinase [Alphaproteobacteria bacterium]